MAFGETWNDGEGRADLGAEQREDDDQALNPDPYGFVREGDLATYHSLRGVVKCRVTGAQAETYRYGCSGPHIGATVEVQVTGAHMGRYGYRRGERIRVTPLHLFPRGAR